VEVLGGIDDPGMEIEIAVRKYEVPHRFSDARRWRRPPSCPRRCVPPTSANALT
jgi:ribonuclease R